MYKIIIKLALANAFLRLSRSLLVMSMIAVSMAMMVAIEGLYDGMASSMIDKTLQSDSGEISLFAAHYRISRSIDDVMYQADEIVKTLRARGDIEALTYRLHADALASTARKSSFATVVGVNTEDEERFGRWSAFIKKGRADITKRGCVVGSELAKRLKLKIGSKLIVSTQDRSAEISALALHVKGIVQTSNIVVDSSWVYIDYALAKKLLGFSEDVATQIALRSSSDTLAATLKHLYPHLEVKRFLELYPMLKQMQEVMQVFNSLTFFIVMIVVFIGIMGVMYVSVLDRIREFAILQSIGLGYNYIRTQILLEASVIGFMGYMLGAILGYGILYYLHVKGLDLRAFSEGLAAFGLDSVIYGDVKSGYFISTFIAIMLSSLLSVIIPLRKIKTMNIVEVTKVQT